MKQIRSIALAAGAAVALGAQAASALEEMTVAYFLEWPMPFQHAKAQGAYDEALRYALVVRSVGDQQEHDFWLKVADALHTSAPYASEAA